MPTLTDKWEVRYTPLQQAARPAAPACRDPVTRGLSRSPACRAQVECIAEYRLQYGIEQWLVKWKNYGEDRNTWEPWENLLTPEVQAEAKQVKESSLPTDSTGLSKLTVARLRDALSSRGQDSTGLKAVLVDRLASFFAQSM